MLGNYLEKDEDGTTADGILDFYKNLKLLNPQNPIADLCLTARPFGMAQYATDMHKLLVFDG